MKKFRTLLTLLLALALVFSLASCVKVEDGEDSSDSTAEAPETKPELTYTADELFIMIDEKMDSYDSYESTIEMIMNVAVNGVEVKSTATGVDIRRGLATDNFEFYTEMQTTVSSSALTSTQRTTSIEAYHGGNYFISNRGTGAGQKFYSPMTKEDAKAYVEEDDTDFFEFGDCVNKEAKLNEDGSYELTFSGYTAKAINEIIDETSLDDVPFDSEVVDVIFNIKADFDFNATALEFILVFEEKAGKTTPEISIKGTFSKYNEAVIDSSAINPAKYTEVYDIKVLEEVTEMLTDRWESEEGKFTLSLTQAVILGSENQTSTEVDNVVYGSNSDGYFYDIDADMDGTKYDIGYSKGIQTVAVDGQSQQAAQNEAEARAFIQSLMNSCQFNAAEITDYKKVSENEISFFCQPKDLYKPVIESMGASFITANQTITVTIENGEVVKIVSKTESRGTFTQGSIIYTLYFNVDSDVTFDK